ncbi:MAG: phosphoribosylformimino-5-aminoimidazole carboxamide ribotide isomerase [Lachnospiraceae bacterium]
MQFRPCIDIHEGKVKQIVGGSLRDTGDATKINFVSGQDSAFYAKLYAQYGIRGGHVILLTPPGNPAYEATREQAMLALRTYPGGLQVGGGITPENAGEYLDAGASHVVVTSYVFRNGRIDYDHLENMFRAVGREHLVIDLSCRKKQDAYYIVTDRWQNYTEEKLDRKMLAFFEKYCDEFLIHAVDVEGKASGIETELAGMLGQYEGNVITYAGGIHSMDDLRLLKLLGRNRVNATIGSALDLFGGSMAFEEVLRTIAE